MRFHSQRKASDSRSFSLANKRSQALKLIESGLALPDVARRLKVSLPTLYKWRKLDEVGQPKILTVTPDKKLGSKLTLSMGDFVVQVTRIEGRAD